MKKIVFIVSILACFFLIGYGNGNAMVSGPCANCHTMHYSQNGTELPAWGSAGPYNTLLINDCLGCHSSSTTSLHYPLGGGNCPVVLYTGGEPTPGTYLAGGNFYWVKEGLGGDDTKGHNVFLGEPDDNLALAPGDPARSLCGGPDNCHANLNQPVPVGIPAHVGRQGCTKCHMMSDLGPTSGYHHADDSNIVVGSVSDDTDGFYRFLTGHQSGSGLGVSGIEDDDWQATTDVDDHNEYLGLQDTLDSGFVGFGALGHTMTGFCCGCHGNFHVEHPGGGDPAWIRHPSDGVIPDRDEYADAYGAAGSGTGVYDVQVPVARDDLTGWPGPSAAVDIGSDMVMCLSCHMSHASPYPDLLRWDYSTMNAGGGGLDVGCFTCHTEKN